MPDKLTKEELNGAMKRIRDCDKLFDGYYNPGGNTMHRDREGAYNYLRVLVFELLEKLEK